MYAYNSLKLALLGTTIFTVCASVIAATQPVPLRVNVMEEKKNAVIHIQQGVVATIGDGTTLNGIAGTTRDFNGQELPAYVIFSSAVSESRLIPLANFQGGLTGTMDCKLIQLGNSPDIPAVKLAVLAQSCLIKTLNH